MRSIHLTIVAMIAMLPLSAAVASPGDVADVGQSMAASTWTVERDFQVTQGRCMTLGEAVEWVRRQYKPQRVISAETRRNVHHIKILTRDNRVRTITVPGC